MQNNVIAYIKDCNYISLINNLALFFLFLVTITNKHKFFLISY